MSQDRFDRLKKSFDRMARLMDLKPRNAVWLRVARKEAWILLKRSIALWFRLHFWRDYPRKERPGDHSVC